jgi:hypothetical protein
MFSSPLTRHATTAGAVIVTGIALAARGGEERPATASTLTTTSAKGRPANVYGTYLRRVTKADITRTESFRDETGPGEWEPSLPGVYRLTIARGTVQDMMKATDPSDLTAAMDVTLDADGNSCATSYAAGLWGLRPPQPFTSAILRFAESLIRARRRLRRRQTACPS